MKSSRMTENGKMLETLEHSLTPFDIQQLTVLKDISKSLAYISDLLHSRWIINDEEEANDAYVRDKLMIDWFMDYYIPLCSDENLMKEEVYKKWMNDMGGKLDGE